MARESREAMTMTMTDLRSQLHQITGQFVSSVLDAMRSSSLSEAAALRSNGLHSTPGSRRDPIRPVAAAASARRNPAGRRFRSTAAEVQRQKAVALATAKALKPGFRKRDVMQKSGSKVDLGRALSLLVADGALTKKGDRRTTRYWVR